MKINNKSKFQLGIFVVSGLLIFVVAVYYLGKQENIFGSGMTVYAEFPNIKGLQVGNNVRFLGTNAGYVSSVSVKNDSIIVVAMVVNNDMKEFIRKNSSVEIRNEGVMGSKILEIQPGTGDFDIIENNDMLPSRITLSMEEVFSALESTVENSIKASENLFLITESIKNGEGALGKLLNDPAMNQSIDDITDNIFAITHDAKVVMDKTNSSQNDLGRLLNDDLFSRKMEQTFVQLDTVMMNMQSLTAEIRQASEAINQGDGVINKLLYDSDLSVETDTTLTKLHDAIDNVTQTSDAIRRSWILNLFSSEQ
jgi:phospholipid/cholesterol/gamma-HCH transport system substrate-binding protein